MLERAYARDASYDGRFIVGVLSTGIYCLPSCPARNPKPENVQFFDAEETAQEAGLRPCKRCRPHYFYRDFDPDLERIREVWNAARSEPERFADVQALATAAGMGNTKLSAEFRRCGHTTPAAFLQRVRVDAARRRLLDSDESLLDVAAAVGFESSSTFHANFRRLTGLSPGDFRRLRKRNEDDACSFVLDLPDGYVEYDPLTLIGRDPESPTEWVDGRSARRIVWLHGNDSSQPTSSRPALLQLDFEGDAAHGLRVRCTVTGAHVRGDSPRPLTTAEVASAHRCAWRMLGLDFDAEAFAAQLARKPKLRRLLDRHPGLRIPQTPDVFEGMVWSIVGQQLNVGFASVLRRRLIELAGPVVHVGTEGVAPLPGRDIPPRAHPTPAEVAQLEVDDLRPLQFSQRKAEYLIDLARAIVAGELDPEALAARPPLEAERTLLARRGFGPWSTHYVMLRACAFADCVPLGDSGLHEALRRFFDLDERPDKDETLRLLEPFSPYRSLATYHLWRTLGDPA